MLFCWTKDRTKRPRMVEIRDQLEKWIRNPELLDASASVVTKTYDLFLIINLRCLAIF